MSVATPDGIDGALDRLARGALTDLDGLLHKVESHTIVGGTRVTTHCYCLKLDGNGRPKLDALVRAITDQAVDYAIPRKRIREAMDADAAAKSTQEVVRLANEARALFTSLDLSGEGGELLLFVLAEKLLRLPQILCKMSLKTSTQMHVHGADGLHVGVDRGSGKLLLYWGESKIYKDMSDAVEKCLKSLAPMLSQPNAGHQDLQLLQAHADLDDAALEEALKKFLDPDTEESNSLEYCGLCLVGFDFDKYPQGPSSTQFSEVESCVVGQLPEWKSDLSKRVTKHNLAAFAMHFLFVPITSADDFRTLLREKLGIPAPAPKPKRKSKEPAKPRARPERKTTKRSSHGTT